MVKRKKRCARYLPTKLTQASVGHTQFETIVILSLTCFVFDLMGIFIGTSLFFPRANLLQIICHFAGGCVISLIIAQSWQYNYIWFAFAFCNLPCTLYEIVILFATFFFKVVVFWWPACFKDAHESFYFLFQMDSVPQSALKNVEQAKLQNRSCEVAINGRERIQRG